MTSIPGDWATRVPNSTSRFSSDLSSFRKSDGEHPATGAIDLHDVVELLLAIADELDAAGESDLLAAAKALLAAREGQIVTGAEREWLRNAVNAAR